MTFIKLISSCLLLIVTVGRSEQSSKLKLFSTNSLEIIKQNNSNKSFILLLWSLDCPPCYKELELVANYNDQELDNLIIISTDDVSRVQEAQKVLNEFKISSNSLWLFAAENKEKLRYSIDPRWRGELPRSYLFKNSKIQDFHSGVLTNDKLKEWISKET